MAGINHLKQVQEKKGDDFLNNLLNNYVIINKKTDGTFFGIKKDKSSDKFKYFKKSGEITYVDRMLMKYYNPAILHFEKLEDEKKQRIPSNFYFGFDYLTKKDSSSNNTLILSYIHRLDDNGKPIETLQTKEDLEKWAYYLGVENPPILFEGMLDDEQKTQILEFVYSKHDKLVDKFKTTSFSKYIISILSEEEEDIEIEDINSIIFRFYDENDENPKSNAFLAKLVDPLFQKNNRGDNSDRPNKSSDYIWLIVIDLMNSIEMFSEEELIKMCEDKDTYDSKYICLINNVFKEFISQYSYKYDGLVLDVPDYLKRDEFDIEYDLINDSKIEELIKKNDTYREIYRVLVNFFRKPRKKSSAGFFGEDLLSQLNIQVGKIKRIVMGDVLYEGLFPSFGEYIGSDIDDNIYVGEHENFIKNKKNKDKVFSKKVNLLIGKFQPVNNGHIKAAILLKEKNDLPCVFIAVNTKNSNSLLSDRSINIMLKKVQQEYPNIIKDIRIVKDSSIKNIMGAIRPDYEPILWGTGPSKINDYALQLEYIKNKNIPLRISKEFKLVEIPQYYRSKDVISAIDSLDFTAFKKMVPGCISSEFFNLQKEIESNRS